jgi:NAD(P)-dependent dehydrogenase (short-subunit alcohol dehydrogenase family)
MNIPSMRVDGKVALITGAGSGIGLAMAEGLAHYGADLVITEQAKLYHSIYPTCKVLIRW